MDEIIIEEENINVETLFYMQNKFVVEIQSHDIVSLIDPTFSDGHLCSSCVCKFVFRVKRIKCNSCNPKFIGSIFTYLIIYSFATKHLNAIIRKYTLIIYLMQ